MPDQCLKKSGFKKIQKRMRTGRKTRVSDNYSLALEGLKKSLVEDCGDLASLVILLTIGRRQAPPSQ